MKLHHWTILLALALVTPASGRIIRGVAAGGMVQLPYSVSDAGGNQWMIYPGGWCQMQGNNPIFSQGAMIMINGGQPQVRNNQARLDDKTGEVIFENMTCNGFTITRRVLIDKEAQYVRYIDIIKNPQAAEQNVNVQIQSNMNFGIDAGQNINDPRHKDNVIGFTTSNGNGRAVVEMYAGKGSKIAPAVTYQQGNPQVQANLQVPVPAA